MVKIGIIGNLSAGKTLLMTYLGMNMSREKDKQIIANYNCYSAKRLTDEKFLLWYKNVLDMEDLERGNEIRKIFKDKIWMIDEAHNILNARMSGTRISELITSMIRFLGKLNCDVIYTSQLLQSDIDKRMREITDILVYPMRVDRQGRPIIFGERKLKEKVMIQCRIVYNMGMYGTQESNIVMDLEDYFRYYDTEEIYVINRGVVK